MATLTLQRPPSVSLDDVNWSDDSDFNSEEEDEPKPLAVIGIFADGHRDDYTEDFDLDGGTEDTPSLTEPQGSLGVPSQQLTSLIRFEEEEEGENWDADFVAIPSVVKNKANEELDDDPFFNFSDEEEELKVEVPKVACDSSDESEDWDAELGISDAVPKGDENEVVDEYSWKAHLKTLRHLVQGREDEFTDELSNQ
jgi:hypothetical protein